MLAIMVVTIPQLQSESVDILKHQLVENVIDHYWKYAWRHWIVLRVFYLLSTLLLTTFTLNLPHPKGDICKHIHICNFSYSYYTLVNFYRCQQYNFRLVASYTVETVVSLDTILPQYGHF